MEIGKFIVWSEAEDSETLKKLKDCYQAIDEQLPIELQGDAQAVFDSSHVLKSEFKDYIRCCEMLFDWEKVNKNLVNECVQICQSAISLIENDEFRASNKKAS